MATALFLVFLAAGLGLRLWAGAAYLRTLNDNPNMMDGLRSRALAGY